jgi:hypothetical protein
VPWLLSTIAHLALLVLLALTFHIGKGAAARSGATYGLALDSVSVSASFGADDGDQATQYFSDEQSGDQAAGAAPTTASSAAAPAESQRALLAQQAGEATQANLAGLGGNSGSLLGAGAFARSGDAGGDGASGIKALTTGAGRPGVGSYRPGKATTGVFGVKGEGTKFVYVFDRSGSMDGYGGAPLAAAKSQLIASLKDLGPTHQFQIIFYNERPQVFSPTGTPGRLVFGTDQNKELARKFVSGIIGDGSTSHETALIAALRMAPDVIFFLTDADEPQLNAAQLQRVARANAGTSINAIEFGYGVQADKNNFLVRLAAQNHGGHVYVDVSRLPPAR